MMRTRLLIALMPTLLLAACGGQEDDDLTRFMNEANHTVAAPVEPLPQVQSFSPKQYNADGTLVDPFVPRKAALQTTHQPDLNRPKEPLEAYPLESLKFVGVLSKKGKSFATIQTPDNLIYQVKIGAHMGEKYGVVTALEENQQTLKYALKVKETIQDPVSNAWTEQMTTLELQEHP